MLPCAAMVRIRKALPVADDISGDGDQSVSESLFRKTAAGAIEQLGCDSQTARRDALLAKVLADHACLPVDADSNEATVFLGRLLKDRHACEYLGLNYHNGLHWIHKEFLESLVWWLLFVTTVFKLEIVKGTALDIERLSKTARVVLACAESAGYCVEHLAQPAPNDMS